MPWLSPDTTQAITQQQVQQLYGTYPEFSMVRLNRQERMGGRSILCEFVHGGLPARTSSELSSGPSHRTAFLGMGQVGAPVHQRLLFAVHSTSPASRPSHCGIHGARQWPRNDVWPYTLLMASGQAHGYTKSIGPLSCLDTGHTSTHALWLG